MSLMDRIKQEAAEGGFKPHPNGIWPATIEDVSAKDATNKEGQNVGLVYELKIRTNVGTAKVGYFKTTVADVEDLYRGQCKTREEAEERYIKTIAKMIRLYTDLGLEAPEGNDELELEYNVYEQLGRLNGAQCTLVVQDNKRDPSKGPVMFVNAPRGDGRPAGGGKTTLERKAAPAAAAKPAVKKGSPQAFGGPRDVNLDDIPFMRRQDEA